MRTEAADDRTAPYFAACCPLNANTKKFRKRAHCIPSFEKLYLFCRWQGGASTHRRLKFDFEEVTDHIVERQELELIERQRDVCQLDHLEIA